MFKPKYKIGDEVQITVDSSNSSYHCFDIGNQGKITDVCEESDYNDDGDISYYVEGEDNSDWVPEKEMKVIKAGKPVKVVPMKYILQYELDEDPFELFATLPEVKARIRELAKDTSLKRDRIYVYEIKKTTKVEISTTTNIKGL